MSAPEHAPVASTSALDPPPQLASFASLGVEPFLVRALAAMAIRKPTAVQAACIPPILKGPLTFLCSPALLARP